jgi:hypothetical protein
MIAVTPTAIRNSSKPIPGRPPGNAGKSLCSLAFLYFVFHWCELGHTYLKHCNLTEEGHPLGLEFFGTTFEVLPDKNKPSYLQLDNSTTNGYGHSLRPIVGAKLLHDVFDMNFDCFLRDEQSVCNVPIPVPAGNVAQNV